MTEQLQLDLDAVRTLADQLQRGGRGYIGGGAEALLRALVRAGLDEDAVVAAAMLCALLDQPPAENGAAA